MTNDKATFVLPDKADRRFAAASAVVYHLWNGTSDEDTEKRVNGFYKVLMAMHNDFGAMMIRSAMLGNKKVTPMEAMKKIMTNRNYAVAAKKFSNNMVQGFGNL